MPKGKGSSNSKKGTSNAGNKQDQSKKEAKGGTKVKVRHILCEKFFLPYLLIYL